MGELHLRAEPLIRLTASILESMLLTLAETLDPQSLATGLAIGIILGMLTYALLLAPKKMKPLVNHGYKKEEDKASFAGHLPFPCAAPAAIAPSTTLSFSTGRTQVPVARPRGHVRGQGPRRHVPLLEVGQDALLRRLARQAQQGDGGQRRTPAHHQARLRAGSWVVGEVTDHSYSQPRTDGQGLACLLGACSQYVRAGGGCGSGCGRVCAVCRPPSVRLARGRR